MADACPTIMTVKRAGAATMRSPEDISTRPFWVEMLLESRKDGEPTAMRAFLEPGVITRWHSHPAGQLLFVLSGVGRAQRDGGDIVELRAGDSVWFAPDERHWHGAAPTSIFSYVSIQGVKDGTAVHWLEPVNEEGNH